MAINLNPGADSSLVAVAYKAGMATTPADYSQTLENVAKGYEKTMEAQSKMWGNVAKLGANIGKEMMANAQEYAAYSAKAGGLDSDAAEFLTEEIYGIKDARRELGFMPGVFGDRETQKKLAKLKIDQANLFADIDAAVESINVGANAVANGLYDSSLDEAEAEKVNAIIKSNLKDKNTDNGNYAKLSRDEKTGELMYTLYDSKTNEPSMLNGVPQTMTIKEFSRSIANSVKDDKNVVGTNMGNIINDIATSGQTSKSGNIDQQAIQLGLNRLDNTLITDTDWKRAMGAKYGYSNTSFIEDLTNKGEVSANLYNNILQTLKLSKPEATQVTAEGPFEGIKDTDGVLGLSIDEINAAYSTYVYNIKSMKDPEASKAVFKEAFATRMGRAHEYGYSKRTIEKISTKNPFTTGVSFKLIDDKGKDVNITKSKDELFVQRSAVLDGQPFEGALGNYYVENDTYMRDGEPISQYDILVQEKLKIPGDKASELGGTQIGAQGGGEFYDISVMDLDDSTLKEKIVEDHGFTVNKNISGINDAGVEVIEVVAPNGVDKRVIYLKGENDTNKERELKRLNDFIREYSSSKTQFVVGNEYPRGGKIYIYQQDGTFKEK